MDIFSFLSLCGGIGMFLYGMKVMSDAINKLAGAKMESVLERLTNSRLKGVALGTAVTGVIQSSTATCIMVIGFVNAGIMALSQAVPVVLGANIGSTVTGQILRLGDISNTNIFLALLKPSAFAPVLIFIGAFLIMLSKRKRTKNVATLLIGLGIIFVGMTTMESAVAPLKDSPSFQNMFVMFQNPLLAILVGIITTCIVQSSSASVGILQALTSTGVITWGVAIPIVIGQNVGKAFPVIVGTLGTNKDSKRVSFIHLLFNIVGAIVVGGVVYAAQGVFHFSFWNQVVNRGNVADFHAVFNIVTAIILLPLCQKLIDLSVKVLPDDEKTKKSAQIFSVLDDIFLDTPGIALEQSRRVMEAMAHIAANNFALAIDILHHYDEDKMQLLDENEAFLDKAETKLSNYLVRITSHSLSSSENALAGELMRNISDFERIGDYCVKIANVSEFDKENQIDFSENGWSEVDAITAAVQNMLNMAVTCFEKGDLTAAARIEPLKEVVTTMRDEMQNRHMERLTKGVCSVQGGISFVELLVNFNRIAGHCANIAGHLRARMSSDFDMHKKVRFNQPNATEEYKAMVTYYESLYFAPLEESAVD